MVPAREVYVSLPESYRQDYELVRQEPEQGRKIAAMNNLAKRANLEARSRLYKIAMVFCATLLAGVSAAKYLLIPESFAFLIAGATALGAATLVHLYIKPKFFQTEFPAGANFAN